MGYYIIGLISPVSPWMKLIVQTSAVIKLKTLRVCLAAHSEPRSAAGSAAFRGPPPPPDKVQLHTAALRPAPSTVLKSRGPRQANSISPGSRELTMKRRLALKVWRRRVHPPTGGKKVAIAKSSEKDHVEHVFSPGDKKNKGKKK